VHQGPAGLLKVVVQLIRVRVLLAGIAVRHGVAWHVQLADWGSVDAREGAIANL